MLREILSERPIFVHPLGDGGQRILVCDLHVTLSQFSTGPPVIFCWQTTDRPPFPPDNHLISLKKILLPPGHNKGLVLSLSQIL